MRRLAPPSAGDVVCIRRPLVSPSSIETLPGDIAIFSPTSSAGTTSTRRGMSSMRCSVRVAETTTFSSSSDSGSRSTSTRDSPPAAHIDLRRAGIEVGLRDHDVDAAGRQRHRHRSVGASRLLHPAGGDLSLRDRLVLAVDRDDQRAGALRVQRLRADSERRQRDEPPSHPHAHFRPLSTTIYLRLN